MRHGIGVVGILLLTAACSDGTAPSKARASVTVLFTDSAGHSSIVRSGEAPTTIPKLDTTELFAAMDDGVVTFSRSRFSIYRFSDPELRLLENRIEPGGIVTPGAVSRDGRRLAYASALNYDVFLHTVDLTSGVRDSVNVSTHTDIPAAPQIAFSVPLWSPSGDTVAFLLPNVLGMQIFLYERVSKRLEVKVMQVATSTYFQVLEGRPHWQADGTIHFLTRRSEPAIGSDPYRVLDTLVVLKVFPREVLPHSEVVSRAVVPDSMTMGKVWDYSFSTDGKSVALGLSTGGRAAIMLMREGQRTLETLVYGPSYRPRRLLLIP